MTEMCITCDGYGKLIVPSPKEKRRPVTGSEVLAMNPPFEVLWIDCYKCGGYGNYVAMERGIAAFWRLMARHGRYDCG